MIVLFLFAITTALNWLMVVVYAMQLNWLALLWLFPSLLWTGATLFKFYLSRSRY